jgi:hypothetical protein
VPRDRLSRGNPGIGTDLIIVVKGTIAMTANQASVSIRTRHSTGKVISFASKQGVQPEFSEQTIAVRESKRYEVCLTRDELPLTVQYDDKTYILVLTKSNKLLLQKPIN